MKFVIINSVEGHSLLQDIEIITIPSPYDASFTTYSTTGQARSPSDGHRVWPDVSSLGFLTAECYSALVCRGLSAFYGKVDSDEERFKVLDRAYELGERHWDSMSRYFLPVERRTSTDICYANPKAPTSTATRKNCLENGSLEQENGMSS